MVARRPPEMDAITLQKKGEGQTRESAKAAGNKTTDANDAIDIIMRYIPSEAIALYIAALPALTSFDSGVRSAVSSLNSMLLHQPATFVENFHLTRLDLILIFAALTGVLVVLIYAGEYNKSNDQKWNFFKRECWPVWGIASSIAAFMVWAWAIPNPLAEGTPEVSPISTFALVATSILLPMIGQVIIPAKKTD